MLIKKLILIAGMLLTVTVVFLTTFASRPPTATCACDKTPSRFSTAANQDLSHPGMAAIPAGTFLMGGNNADAKRDEFPTHKVHLHAFWMDVAPVTNADFQRFVADTGYVTTAEKKPDWEELKKQLPTGTPKPDESRLVAASLVFTPPDHPVNLANYGQWWTWMAGANWKHPRGPKSSIDKVNNHPVVHISWDDANAYCQWKQKRLPTEAEWEWAARGGLKDKIYPWGNEPIDTGKVKANTWQGRFPSENTLRDGYYYTSPVKSFSPNGYGLYDMAGNVWEWVADWYGHDYYRTLAGTVADNPKGPTHSFDPDEPYAQKKVLRGGSWLCSPSYCTGYRVAARMKSTPDTSMEHTGFRCAL